MKTRLNYQPFYVPVFLLEKDVKPDSLNGWKSSLDESKIHKNWTISQAIFRMIKTKLYLLESCSSGHCTKESESLARDGPTLRLSEVT